MNDESTGGERDFEDLVAPSVVAQMQAVRGSIRALRASADLREALPELLARLERLRRTEPDPELHVGLLSVYRKPVLQALKRLQKPGGSRAEVPVSPAGPRGVSSEQRLIFSMTANLQLPRFERWAVSNLFGFMERQVRFGVCLRRPLPGNSWLQIHDTFDYLLGRGKASLDPRAGLSQPDPRRDPTVLYLRLLLLGVLGTLTEGPRPIDSWAETLWPMALDSRLREPEAHLGEFGLFLVETSLDRPPRLLPGALDDAFRGWLLFPGDGFLGEVTRLQAGVRASG
jgi:hypothetical protein